MMQLSQENHSDWLEYCAEKVKKIFLYAVTKLLGHRGSSCARFEDHTASLGAKEAALSA